MMDETGIEDLDELGIFIIDSTSRAMRESINRLPKGTVCNRMTIDGFDRPIELVASLTVGDGEIVVDFAGTSPYSDYGINCPKCYTDAYTAFGVKCVVAPKLPNNAGSLAAIKTVAPENTIINAPHPCAVVARSTVGHMLPDLVFGCLHQIVPGQVPAEGTSCLWNLKLGAGPGMTSRTTRTGQPPTPFMVMSFHSGGAGARPSLDGLSATPFPSGVKNVPIEVTEAISPLVIWKKEYRQDSGGPGKFRGGLGQTMVVGNREGAEFAIFATYDRVVHPPRGREGGANGMAGRVSLGSGAAMKGMGRQIIPAGDRVVIEMPGGGGYGNPAERDVERIREDVRSELVSREAAERDYGIVVTGGGPGDPGRDSGRRETTRTAPQDW